MAGRRPKPVNLHVVNGNPSKLSKAQIEERKKTEVVLGTSSMTVPETIKHDPVALDKFKKLAQAYKKAELASSTDVEALAAYCATWSRYCSLLELREDLTKEKPYDLEMLFKLDTRIDQAVNSLCKLGDRLYLNPASKVRIPKKKNDKEDDDPMSKLLGRRPGSAQ